MQHGTKIFVGIEEAARLCAMSRKSFEKVCPVKPVNLPLRKNLYDVRALADWADELAGRKHAHPSPESAYDEGKRRQGAA